MVACAKGHKRSHKSAGQETEALDAGLVEALGVLRVGTEEEHRTALQSVALTSPASPPAGRTPRFVNQSERIYRRPAATEQQN